MTKPKQPVGRPRNKSVEKIVKDTGYTRRHARTLILESKTSGESLDDLQTLRRKKVQLEVDRLKFQNDVAKGLYVLKADIEEEGVAMGMAIKAQLYAWAGALPGRLEGLTANQMSPIFDEEIYRVLKLLAGHAD